MSESGHRKWQCVACSYLNYQRAVRCTMCSAVRPAVQLIIEDECRQRESPDIYKMFAMNESNSDILSKWSCDLCTFLNQNNSFKCIQCLTSRNNVSSGHKSEAESRQTASRDVVTNRSSPDRQQKPMTSETIENNDKNGSLNDKNKLESIGVQLGLKWSCSACTYDNWNAAKKCVLCLTPRKTPLLSTGCEPQETFTSCDSSLKESEGIDKESDLLSNSVVSTKDSVKNCSNSDYNTIKNKINDNLSEVSPTADERIDYIEDGHNQRFQEIYDLDLLISESSRPVRAKRVPSDVNRYLAAEIRRQFSNALKQRKGEFGCYFITEFLTFALPAEIEDLSPQIQERLFDEYLDRDVQKELEDESPIINWSLELTERLGSRLYALWNRSTGDCLLDSVLQATYGIFDRDNRMRKALGDSLSEGSSLLFSRFRDAESLQANMLHFTLDDDQWREDWAIILSLASQPGQSLEQIHIFTLAHILRRPIIVYAIRIVKSFRGDSLGYAGYEGIYLPLLWEQSFCWKSPIALGYTRGHFSALVAIEPSDQQIGAGANFRSNDDSELIYLPLVTSEHQLLPLHFLGQNELGREEDIIRQWLDCCVTTGGILAAKQKIPPKPVLVAQMMDEWLHFYRNLPQNSVVETNANNQFSSDDSDQEI